MQGPGAPRGSYQPHHLLIWAILPGQLQPAPIDGPAEDCRLLSNSGWRLLEPSRLHSKC